MSRRTFTNKVISGGMVTIPESFRDLYDIEKDDQVQLALVTHKKDGELIIEDGERVNNGT